MTDLSDNRLAVSTVWAKARTGEAAPLGPAAEARAVLDALDELGLSRIELEYRLPGPVIERLLPEFAARSWRVVSLHNFVPLPEGVPREMASGDLFNLAALDGEERRQAVEFTMGTLELASELEVGAVVLHLGGVSGVQDKAITPEAARAGGRTPKLEAHLARRAELAPRHLDAVSFSLERLASRAQGLGVRLGLENRYHAFQIPDLAEMGLLLTRFEGPPLGLWYDCGHAHVQELAGLGPAEAWWQRFGDTLVGCHLHDAQGPEDHAAPGTGDLDWPGLSKDLAMAPNKVLEVAYASAGELREGAEMLEGLFALAEREAKEKGKA